MTNTKNYVTIIILLLGGYVLYHFIKNNEEDKQKNNKNDKTSKRARLDKEVNNYYKGLDRRGRNIGNR